MSEEINIIVAGEAGQGVKSVGFILAKGSLLKKIKRNGYTALIDEFLQLVI